MSTPIVDRTYGNITVPKSPGFLGVGTAAAASAGAGAVAGLVAFFFGSLLLGAIFLTVGVIGAVVLSLGKRHGRSGAERIVGRALFRRAQRTGSTSYVSGPTSGIPDGTFRAPGILAGTEMYQFTDHFGQPFAMLWDPRVRTGTVFFSTQNDGAGLRDQDDIDQLVDGWAGYLRNSGSVVDLLQVAVTTQATKDQGARLPAAKDAERETYRQGEVPAYATDAVDEMIAVVNAGNPQVVQWLAATFTAAPLKEEGQVARTARELAVDLTALMPTMVEQLTLAGAGSVSSLTAADVTDQVHVAYNPDTALAVERARLTGQGTGLSWEEVGPADAHATRVAYHHGSFVSRSFQVWKPPAGVFRENSLVAVLSPNPVCEQNRVTLLYRTFSPQRSAARVQTTLRNAEFEANQKGRRVTAVASAAVRRARVAEIEQAAGAAVMRFSIVITTTVASPELLPRAEAAVKRACSTGVQLQVRSCTDNEDAAFAIGLGLGSIPARYATIPSGIREAL